MGKSVRRLWSRYLRWLLLVAAGVAGCGDETDVPSRSASRDPGPIHVHGLGVNPADRSLFVATHTGLFRAGPDEGRARRVGDRHQDTTGFAVVGPDHFLGSGHPDARERLPPFLGLIESRDAGRTWRPVSLEGKVDFHRRIYGYGSDWASCQARFLTSSDGGRQWRTLSAPEPLVSLAISPSDSRALVASGDRGVFRSADSGRSWSDVDAPGVGLLVWTRDGVVLVDLEGSVWHGEDPTVGRWRPVGTVGGQPSALESESAGELLVALHDGTVKHSTDVGRSWSVRSRP